MSNPFTVSAWPPSAARKVLAALVIVLGVGNLVGVVVAGRQAGALLQAYPAHSEAIVLAVPAGGGRVLVASNANQLLLLSGGLQIEEYQLDSLIGGIATTGTSTYFAGTSLGDVVVLDAQFHRVRTMRVSGRIVGLAATPQGGLFVAHGIGPYSSQYYVSYFPAAAVKPAYTAQVDFTITALAAAGEWAYFGTLNSRVGAIDPGGRRVWDNVLRNPITRLLPQADSGSVAVGDQYGTVTLLDAHGATRWSTSLGAAPVQSLAYDSGARLFLAGDSEGTVSLLSLSGRVALSQRIAANQVVALLPLSPSRIVAVPYQGPWRTLDLQAVSGQQRADQIRAAQYLLDALSMLVLLPALVLAVPRLRLATRRVGRSAWRGRLGYLFALPALALIAIFTYYPAVSAVYYSLTDFSLGSRITHVVGLQNYRNILGNDHYFRVGLLNMVIIAVTSILKSITVPLLVAELVYWLRNARHRYVYRTLFVLPAVVPSLVFILLWQQVYDPDSGLLNQLLRLVDLGGLQRAWLGDDATALWAVIGVGFPFVSAFSFLVLLGGLLTISTDYFDAARVDGAGWWARFRHIDLPLLVPQFRILLFFALTGTIDGFTSIFVLTRGGPGSATYVPALEMYLHLSDGDFGYASAIGVILFVAIFALTIVILRFRRREMVEVG